ncbi:hypothetical protein [Maritalea sp. S77]|uniref:hypothetical protein n=1 Tax=Maritalea sp. S77 TaxID=3415125 RepID=UPI003C7A0403
MSVMKTDPYQGRDYVYCGRVQQFGFELKTYSICAKSRTPLPTDPIFSAAMEALHTSQIIDMPHQGIGYLMVHFGEAANWVLTRVWREGDIVAGLLTHFEAGKLLQVDEPMIECVWEEVIVHHERNAWVKHMMGGAGKEGYLADHLADGQY